MTIVRNKEEHFNNGHAARKDNMLIVVDKTVTVEAEGQKPDLTWDHDLVEVKPGQYFMEEPEILKGLLSGFCPEIMPGDVITFQPGDWRLPRTLDNRINDKQPGTPDTEYKAGEIGQKRS